jgi:hypothetical protein
MKKLVFILLALSFSLTAFSRTNEFIVYSLIAKRCERYMPENKMGECQETVMQMMDLLDYDVIFSTNETTDKGIPQSFVFVAFRKNLINLLENPATAKFLENLNIALNDYLLGTNETFNIWELSSSHYKSEFKSSQVIATLFQDISNAKLHLRYLEKAGIEGSETFKQNKNLLEKTIDTINMVVDYHPENFQKIFYPKGSIGTSLNRNLYHFYVPLHLSLALQKSSTDKHMTFIAPFLMTLTYEFITTSNDYRYILTDPERLDTTEHAWKLKDIYGGYCGASKGLGKKPAFNLSEMGELFNVSSYEAVTTLLK